MICDNCNGKGYTINPKLYKVPSWKAYEMGYDQPVRCKKCGGTGFILSNAKEVIEKIDFAIKNNMPLTMKEMKQIKLLLMKVE